MHLSSMLRQFSQRRGKEGARKEKDPWGAPHSLVVRLFRCITGHDAAIQATQ